MGYKHKRERTLPIPPTERANVPIKVYIPKSLYEVLKTEADKLMLPVSRLVSYAVDKDMENKFAYDCEEPKMPFVKDSHIDEAGKIFRFLKKYGPHAVDQLMLARREIGLPNKLDLLLGVRELLSMSAVQKLIPNPRTFRYGPGYRTIAAKISSDEKKQKEIQHLEEKLQKLKDGYGLHGSPETSDSEETDE